MTQSVFLAGTLLIFFNFIWDMFFYNNVIRFLIFDSERAMLVFVFYAAAAVFIATMREVEEAKMQEQRLTAKTDLLVKLNRSKTEFLQDMSHEMKAPMTVIAAGIDVAESVIGKETIDVDKAKNVLETIRGETQRLGRMVSGMVAMASMNETGENRKRVDFAALLTGSAGAFRMTLTELGNSLDVKIAPDLPDIFVEHDRIKQVITNLLNNAAEHTAGGGISLAASAQGKYITVTVTDTGSGITPELLPRVFMRGVSGKGATGYGLYLCKTIVEAHGGTISIESEPDKGTAVTFTVPVYAGQEAGQEI
jgi:signal transduction histidine kinase